MPIASEVSLALALTLTSPTALAPDAADLRWLAGHWCGRDGVVRFEEHWLAPVGGQMQGMSRTTRAGKVQSFEFLRIAPVDGVLTYLAQPGGQPPTAFAMTASAAAWIRFENPAHDFPARIEYRRTGKKLRAEVSGPGKDGTSESSKQEFVPCAEAADQSSA